MYPFLLTDSPDIQQGGSMSFDPCRTSRSKVFCTNTVWDDNNLLPRNTVSLMNKCQLFRREHNDRIGMLNDRRDNDSFVSLKKEAKPTGWFQVKMEMQHIRYPPQLCNQ